jgi:hypothetical protein
MVEQGRRERRSGVVILKVDAVEERPLVGMRGDEQRAELERVGQQAALTIHGPRNVETEFEPLGNAPGELRRAIERVVRREAAREARLIVAEKGVIQVLLDSELSDLGNLRVIDLDFIDRLRRRRLHQDRRQDCGRQAEPRGPSRPRPFSFNHPTSFILE